MVAIPRYEEKYAPNLKGGTSQVSAANPVAETIGRFGETINKIGAQIQTQRAQQEQQQKQQEEQKDQLAVSEAQNKMKEYALQLRYDPEIGYLNQTGPGAFDSANEFNIGGDVYTQMYQNRANEIQSSLTSPRQQQLFQAAYGADALSFRENFLAHQHKQTQLNETHIFNQELGNSLNLVGQQYNDPDTLAQERKKQDASVRRMAAKSGFTPQQIEQVSWEQNSNFHIAVIQGAINNNDSDYAQTYIQQNQGQIDHDELAIYMPQLEDLKTVRLGENQAISYLQELSPNQANENTIYTIKEQLRQNPQLRNNPKALDAALYTVDYEIARKTREEKIQQDKTMGELKTAIDQKAIGYYNLSPLLRNNLTEENQQKLRRYDRYKQLGQPIEQSDVETLLKLKDDRYLKNIGDGEFALLEAYLDKDDYNYYAFRREDLLNGGDGAGKPEDPRGLNTARFDDIFNLRILSLRGVSTAAYLTDPAWLATISQIAKKYVLTTQAKTGQQLGYKEMEKRIDKWFMRHYKTAVSYINGMR